MQFADMKVYNREGVVPLKKAEKNGENDFSMNSDKDKHLLQAE